MQQYTILTAYAVDRAWDQQRDLAMRYIPAQDAARPSTSTSQDSIIERMDTSDAQTQYQYDLDQDGLRRSHQGQVGDAQMTVQVATLGGDRLITFWYMDRDGHQRRFLVDSQNRTWLDTRRGVAVRQAIMYDEAIAAILKARSN